MFMTNRIIHGRLEIRNLSSRVQFDLLRVASLEHEKMNFISPNAHMLFTVSLTFALYKGRFGKYFISDY